MQGPDWTCFGHSLFPGNRIPTRAYEAVHPIGGETLG